jgi:hypothetical protein
MINCTKIQYQYNRLYREIRNYIWDFDAVEALADLEIEVYKTCQDLDSIRNAFSNLRLYTREVEYYDEDLAKALDKFEELINSDDTPYAKLWMVKETVQ